MHLDVHYHAVLAFSRACGFTKESAHQIAYASQFVDDAKINHVVIKGDPGDIRHDVVDGQPSFFNIATCHGYFRIKTFNYSAMINNTCAFHFVPGLNGESFVKKLRCSEESTVAVNILKESLEHDDPVKLGMVLHPYADTFAHQGFSGMLSKVNDIRGCKTLSKVPWNWSHEILKLFQRLNKNKLDRLFDSGVPAYGHAQAWEYPDLPYLAWSYEYDYTDHFSEAYKSSGAIDNKDRFKRALQKIRGHLDDYLTKHPEYRDETISFQDFDVLFDALVINENLKKRVKNWQKILVDQGLLDETDPGLVYDENRWLREAFKNFEEKRFHQRKLEGGELAAGFPDSNWYRYCLAVEWYKERFFHHCVLCNLAIPR